VIDDDLLPTVLPYRRRSRVYPLIMIVVLALWIGPGAVIFLSAAISAAIKSVIGLPQVVIVNESTATFVAWLTADEIPPPDSEGVSTPPRVEFEIVPRSTSMIPRDHPWAIVEIWTAGCEVVLDSSSQANLPTRIRISSDGTAAPASASDPPDATIPAVLATATHTCAPTPWTPPGSANLTGVAAPAAQ